jgi:hypothetical protein
MLRKDGGKPKILPPKVVPYQVSEGGKLGEKEVVMARGRYRPEQITPMLQERAKKPG